MSERKRIERPRGTHDVVPAEMPLWERVTGEVERLCRLYGYRPIVTPVFEDTALFLRTSGEGSDLVQKEMYTFADRGGPLAHAATRGDASDLPRVSRARHAAATAAGEALHARVDLPLRGAPERALPRALAGVGRGDRLRRPVHRRRADPALRHASRPARHHRVPAGAELDRLPRVPPCVPRDTAGVARRERSPPRRRDPREDGDEPAARARQLLREAGRGSRSALGGACDRRLPLRGLCRALLGRSRRPGRGRGPLRARADARARSRLLHAYDLGVHRARARCAELASAAAGATTTSSRTSAGRRRRGSASAQGSSGCCSPSSMPA